MKNKYNATWSRSSCSVERSMTGWSGGRTVVVEVKSGRRREHPSLSKVDSVFEVDRKILLGLSNISRKGDVECYPLFAAAFMDVWDTGWDDLDA